MKTKSNIYHRYTITDKEVIKAFNIKGKINGIYYTGMGELMINSVEKVDKS